MNLPICPHCESEPEVDSVGPEDATLFFVVCRSEKCRPGGVGWGRPLSNGKGTRQAAEDDWRAECARRGVYR
jgi:hypothetical protein